MNLNFPRIGIQEFIKREHVRFFLSKVRSVRQILQSEKRNNKKKFNSKIDGMKTSFFLLEESW
jgi:hypothetical protein